LNSLRSIIRYFVGTIIIALIWSAHANPALAAQSCDLTGTQWHADFDHPDDPPWVFTSSVMSHQHWCCTSLQGKMTKAGEAHKPSDVSF
jgi:hypothetical protein